MTRQSTEAVACARSLLFVPGDRPDRTDKAFQSGADVVIIDLEDGVAAGQKLVARDHAVRSLERREASASVVLRVNSAETSEFLDDVHAAQMVGVDALMLPKAEPAALGALPEDCPPIVALIETAVGLAHVQSMAADPRVVRLALGPADLSLELGLIRRADGLELLAARSALVLATALAKLPAPIDGPSLDVDAVGVVPAEAALVRSLGFGGKLCIHPTQVDPVNRAFSPSREEVAHAQEVIATFERAVVDGSGVAKVRGVMVDRPIVEQARRVLERVGHGKRS